MWIFRAIVYEIFKRFVYIDFVWWISRFLFITDILFICFYSMLSQRHINHPLKLAGTNKFFDGFRGWGGKLGQTISVQCFIVIPPENRKSKGFVMLGVMVMKHCAEDKVDLAYTLSIGTF